MRIVDMQKHKVGDIVYVASYGRREERVPCPVCFGKLAVTVILGDDTHISTPCNYCGHGYESPTGTVMEYVESGRVDALIIIKIATEDTVKGTSYSYYYADGRYSDDHNAFLAREEAEGYADELAAEHKRKMIERAEYIKKDKHKSFSWNVGYHMREVKNLTKRAEHHKEMAQICKARTKQNVSEP